MKAPQRNTCLVNDTGTNMDRIEDAIKQTSETGARVALSCTEVAFVPQHESEALEQLEQAIDAEAVSKNRAADRGKRPIPWSKVKRMLNL